MSSLLDQIRKAVAEDRFVVSNHADERLRERLIEFWQIQAGIDDAVLLSERPRDLPNPSIEVEQRLADGSAVKVVWAYAVSHGVAVLVTVHFLET